MKWEYHIEILNTQDKFEQIATFNRLGKEGWECFWIFTAPSNFPTAHMFFKRELRGANAAK